MGLDPGTWKMEEFVHILGIDPGKTSGAIVLMEKGGAVIHRETMPPVHKLCDLIDSWRQEGMEIHCWLEKAQTMPKQGGVSVFRYGQHYGTLEGILIAMDVRHTVVHPSTWTKTMHSGCSVKLKGREGAKKRSLEAAMRLWPRDGFLASERAKKPHDGLIDAMLIAEYGRRQL